jgi:hypothetical protein
MVNALASFACFGDITHCVSYRLPGLSSEFTEEGVCNFCNYFASMFRYLKQKKKKE